MPEIASAWVTLAISAQGMKRDIRRAFNEVERSAKLSPHVDDSKLSTEGANAGRQFGTRFSAAAKLDPKVNASGVAMQGDRAGREYGERFSRSAKTAMTALTAAAAGGVIAGGLAVLTKGFDRLKAIDDARFKLQALGNDTATTAKIMDSALASVKGTAYSLGDAATIAASAVAAGVKPGEELTKYLKLTADASAVAGTSLGDMGRIINQVRTGQKAYTDDLNQLADRGIPIYQWLAEEAGVAAGDVKKLASEGKISAQQFEDAISKHIGGAAQKMGKSFDGAVQNLQASTARLGANLITAILGGKPGSELDGPTEAVSRLTEKFDEVGKWVNDHSTDIHDLFANVGKAVKVVGDNLGAVVGFLTEHPKLIQDVVVAFAAWKTISAIGSVAGALGGVGSALDLLPGKASNAATKMNRAFAGLSIALPGLVSLFNQINEGKQGTDPATAGSLIVGGTVTGASVAGVPGAVVGAVIGTGAAVAPALINGTDPNAGPMPTDPRTGLPASQSNAPAGTRESGDVLPPWRRLEQQPTIPGRAFGAIVKAFADGGFNWITKPQAAGLYQGRGAGTVFAEQETGGEAYIPLAQSKRPRSMRILMEVARLFGLNRNAEGSITVDDLKAYASSISGQSYNWGGGNGDTFATDCSGAQATIANYITGANGRFSTADEAQALLARGFQQGDPPAGIAAYWVGWKNGGPGGGHTAGTILDPEGGNVNVEMGGKSGGGQFGGTAAGASEFPNRAWIALAGYGDDPTKTGGSSAAVKSAQASVTSAKASTASAQNNVDKAQSNLDTLNASGASQDKITAAEKKLDVAQQKLAAAQERQSAAETKLSEVKDKQASKAEQSSDNSGQDLGKSVASSLFGGLMESIGLPGFANLLDMPNVKSGMAALNAFAGPIKGAMEGKLGIQQAGWSPGMPIGEDGNVVGLPGGGGGLPGVGMPGVGDFLKPIPDAGLQPLQHQGSGAAPGPVQGGGPSFVVNGNVGMDPKALTQRFDAKHNEAWRGRMAGVRPQ